MTLDDLSKRSGLHSTTISQIERGKRNLTLTNLSRLADGLEVVPYQLLLGLNNGLLIEKDVEQIDICKILDRAPENRKQVLLEAGEILLAWEKTTF